MKRTTTTDLPALLRKMRGDRTLEEFGAAYGASKQLVSNWDAGRSKPNAETLALMGIQVVYVFTPTPTNEK